MAVKKTATKKVAVKKVATAPVEDTSEVIDPIIDEVVAEDTAETQPVEPQDEAGTLNPPKVNRGEGLRKKQSAEAVSPIKFNGRTVTSHKEVTVNKRLYVEVKVEDVRGTETFLVSPQEFNDSIS